MCVCCLGLLLSKNWGKRNNVITRWKWLNCSAEQLDKGHLLQVVLWGASVEGVVPEPHYFPLSCSFC